MTSNYLLHLPFASIIKKREKQYGAFSLLKSACITGKKNLIHGHFIAVKAQECPHLAVVQWDIGH
jgi:hypothetical protein